MRLPPELPPRHFGASVPWSVATKTENECGNRGMNILMMEDLMIDGLRTRKIVLHRQYKAVVEPVTSPDSKMHANYVFYLICQASESFNCVFHRPCDE